MFAAGLNTRCSLPPIIDKLMSPKQAQVSHWYRRNMKTFKCFPFVRRVRKIAKSDCYLHVCPSVRMEQLGSRWRYFREILYLSIFRKSIEKIQVYLISDKNGRYITPLWSYLTELFLEWHMLPTKVAEKFKTHFMFNNCFSKPCRLWDNGNTVQSEEPRVTIWRVACWITKATNTRSE